MAGVLKAKEELRNVNNRRYISKDSCVMKSLGVKIAPVPLTA
jgi:hypothetical protein